MFNRFQEYINKEQLVEADDRILLTVSGGIDSIAMLHLFNQTTLDFGIAHCNFQLRGKEAIDDQEFVRKLANSLNKPLQYYKLNRFFILFA